MKLENAFEVSAPPDRTWAFLVDPELVVPCMPGAELQGALDDETWEARSLVKLGPVSMRFKGRLSFIERDDDARHLRLAAKGTETRGKGMFEATISGRVEPTDEGSRVTVITELKLSGKAATFSRGMVGDVSKKLTGEFAKNMEGQLEAIEQIERDRVGPAPGTGPTQEAGREPQEQAEREPEPEPGLGERPEQSSSQVEKLPTPPPLETRAVGGLRLALWALWRGLVRWLRRLFGAAHDELE